jgi:predicted Fe-Mo cluster-binding NifX family protein
MKIAVPTTQSNTVDSHFGHCEFYTIFTIAGNNTIGATETMSSPQGCGCKSNVASILQEKGVSIMLAGNMGDGAMNVLTKHGMKVFRGNTGDVRALAETFLQGKVGDSGEGCHHHEGDGTEHVCNH